MRCARCSPMRRRRRSASTASTTCTCCAATASTCTATTKTRCSKASCFNAGASRHDMDSLAKRYLGYDTVRYEDVAGKGAKQIPFSHVSRRRRDALRRRRRRRHAAPAFGAAPEARGRAVAGRGLSRHRNPAGAGARARGSQRHPGRRRRTAPPVRRPRQAHARSAAAGHRTRGPHLQPGFAQAGAASCCSTNSSCPCR